MLLELSSAFALVLIIEGILPLLVPNLWRDTFAKMGTLTNDQLRIIGLFSMIMGLLILIMVR